MKEEEIRPYSVFEEYLRLSAEDISTYFSGVDFIDTNCPACNQPGESAFVKSNFHYECCTVCQTLYVNPRPVSEAFNRFYKESPSSKYWASTFYKKTAEARREKLWRPKAKLVFSALDKYNASSSSVVDIGGGYGIFAQEYQKLSNQTVLVIEPGPNLASICREKRLNVVEKFLEDVTEQDLPNGSRVFVSFELFEHLFSPNDFLSHLLSIMNTGDIFLFTTLSGTGLDIQVLWEDSKSVNPPHHLNFFNPSSIQSLLVKNGFEMLEVTTPGKLDIDILINNQSLIKDRFWKNFIRFSSQKDQSEWQNLVSSSSLSSHMMTICRKP